MLARARELGDAERVRQLGGLLERLRSLPELSSAGTVELFAPLQSEPDVFPLFFELRALGARVAFPGYHGGPAAPELRLAADESELSVGEHGFRHPRPGRAIAVSEVDLFLVPALAFDRRGHRLGRGLGYFDRLLAGRRAGSLAVGVVFSFGLVDRLPSELHDRPVDLVATPEELVDLRRGPQGA